MSLLAKAEAAETAYKKGYDLLDRYRFQESIPYLQQALAEVRLPDFYLALGAAYGELPDLDQAERVLREGLALVNGKADEKHNVSCVLHAGRDAGRVDARHGLRQEALEQAQLSPLKEREYR